jgi:hypothetical protein
MLSEALRWPVQRWQIAAPIWRAFPSRNLHLHSTNTPAIAPRCCRTSAAAAATTAAAAAVSLQCAAAAAAAADIVAATAGATPAADAAGFYRFSSLAVCFAKSDPVLYCLKIRR